MPMLSLAVLVAAAFITPAFAETSVPNADATLASSESTSTPDDLAVDDTGATAFTVEYGNFCDGNTCYITKWECIGSTCTLTIVGTYPRHIER